MTKTILLAGASSNVGKTLLPLLSDYTVSTMGRENCYDYSFDASEDIHDEKNITKHYDVMINTIAAFGSDSTDSFYYTEKVNTLGILKLCEIAKKCGVKHFIHISSLSADYEPQNPFYNIYSLSKKHADELLKLFCKKEKINYTILKPSQIYSCNMMAKKHQKFLYAIAEKIINNSDVYINGTNDATRNYIHIDDVCELILEVIKKQVYGEYTCSALDSITISKLVNILKNATNSRSKLIFDPSKPDIPSLPEINDFKLYEILNYKPQKSLEENINKFIEGVIND